MAKYNVLFINKFREIGGSEVFLLEILRNLDRSKYRPILSLVGETCAEAADILADENVRVYPDLFREPSGRRRKGEPLHWLEAIFTPQGRRSPFEPAAIFRLAHILRKENIHLVFYLDKHAALNLVPLAALLGHMPALIGSFHTPGLLFSLPEKMLLPLTSLVTATSDFHRRYLVDQLGMPPDKVRVLYNGIGTDRFKGAIASDELRDELGLAPEAPVIGMLARLVEQKNHELFLQAAAEIVKDYPRTSFLIIGDGPKRKELEGVAADLGLGARVRFLGYRPDIGELLSLCDISVLSTHDEFFPYTILESMLMGVPVVATDVGAVSEMIDDGESGFLVPPDDAEKLVAAIGGLLRNPEERKRLGQAGRERVIANFSSQVMTRRVEELFEGCLLKRYHHQESLPALSR